MKRSPSRFARIPQSVWSDTELTRTDISVYCALAQELRAGNIVSLGQRRIAELSGVDRRSVRRSLENLARRGHLSAAISRLDQRTILQLNSPVFLADTALKVGAAQRPLLGASERPRSRVSRQQKPPLIQ